METVSNLDQLDKNQRSDHLARRKEIYERLHPETKPGGDRKSNGNNFHLKNSVSSFAEETSKKIGTTERSVRQEVKISKAIPLAVKKLMPEYSKRITQAPGENRLNGILMLYCCRDHPGTWGEQFPTFRSYCDLKWITQALGRAGQKFSILSRISDGHQKKRLV